MNDPMGPPAVEANAAADQRVPAARTVANLGFLLRVLLPGSAVETGATFPTIECRLAGGGVCDKVAPTPRPHARSARISVGFLKNGVVGPLRSRCPPALGYEPPPRIDSSLASPRVLSAGLRSLDQRSTRLLYVVSGFLQPFGRVLTSTAAVISRASGAEIPRFEGPQSGRT